jgi:hypothetical protein
MDRRYRFEALPNGRFHDLFVSLDKVDPGFLGWIIRLPESRRQVAYAILSNVGAEFLRPNRQGQKPALPNHEQLIALRPVLKDMRELRPRDLLGRHFGSCPDGYLGALRKTECGPQGVLYYPRLYTVFTDPEHKQIAKVIRQLQSMDMARLKILFALDPIFLWPKFCSIVRDAQQAADLSVALVMIRQIIEEEASNEALTASIRSIGENTSVARWVESWLHRAKHIAYPRLDLGSEWVALDTGAKMTEAGLRFQNCLRDTDRIADVLKGRVYYFENRSGAVIAEVQAVGPQRFLMLTGVHTKRNAIVSRGMRRETQKAFLAASVPSLDWTPEDHSWQAIERIPNGLFSLQDFDTLDDLDAIDELSEAEREVA